MKYIFKNKYLRKWEKDSDFSFSSLNSKKITPQFLNELLLKQPELIMELKHFYKHIRNIINDDQIDLLQDLYQAYIFIPLDYLNKIEILKSCFARHENVEIFYQDNILDQNDLEKLRQVYDIDKYIK
ncbi:hypothetical protein FJO69_02385 [[Mycoplasma] falconis]|uniref:Uncharacterized protein n=1 Tax=[Mycoplasma] falconis TaxID=92403 RepID=A0A501X9U7_9BACT|nr:hypothetical protein [[Mycoplasma] falconis]TPE57153.1 hypothetical protein FJO69_02385 [[Mycoplasma] falconis]